MTVRVPPLTAFAGAVKCAGYRATAEATAELLLELA
jgi:hypothetical protein